MQAAESYNCQMIYASKGFRFELEKLILEYICNEPPFVTLSCYQLKNKK
jgi:hypothetical protein